MERSADGAQELATGPFELRYDLHGRCAVRIAGGPVARLHAEPSPPPAAWCAEARCGAAAGWLLAATAPDDPERARQGLEQVVARRTALKLADRAAASAALSADLLERLTHRLRTDVMALQSMADAALAGLLDDADRTRLPAELARTAREAQRRLTAARQVMAALDPAGPPDPEPIAETLRAELEGAGRERAVVAPTHERPRALVPGPGWAACARLLAADGRLGAFAVEPDPDGWRIASGAPGTAVDWTERELGPLFHAGHIAAAAGGAATAERSPDGGLRVVLVVPAAPSIG